MLKLFNFLSRKVEEFDKSTGDTVGFYTCGPTVYDFVHIGNWRTFVFEDILKRVLTLNGYKVNHIMNITDIDDKIIARSREQRIELRELTAKYEKAFFADLEKLNIIKADQYPCATDHITSMIRIIEALLEKGVAYEREGSVYFAIGKFADYGKLSGTNIKGVKAGARVDVDEYDKDNPQDFALWKKALRPAQDKKEHIGFDSPWGVGRPGWHVECSAMSMQYLGETFDIHTGGVDLLFPHHENEIAQSEAATGKKFVNFWLEGEHLLIEGEKMAKRSGNIFTLKDVVDKGFDPLALRYLFLTAHYRSQLNFTWKSLEAAQSALNSIRYQVSGIRYGVGPVSGFLPASARSAKKLSGDQRDRVELRAVGNPPTAATLDNKEFLDEFRNAVNEDLDIPKALSIGWKVLKSDLDDSAKYATILEFDKVLGLGLDQIHKAELPEGAKELIDRREQLRAEGDFKASDKLREDLKSMGVEVEDTNQGPKWRIKKK